MTVASTGPSPKENLRPVEIVIFSGEHSRLLAGETLPGGHPTLGVW